MISAASVVSALSACATSKSVLAVPQELMPMQLGFVGNEESSACAVGRLRRFRIGERTFVFYMRSESAFELVQRSPTASAGYVGVDGSPVMSRVTLVFERIDDSRITVDVSSYEISIGTRSGAHGSGHDYLEARPDRQVLESVVAFMNECGLREGATISE
jgi:hypothetical protein